MHSAPQSSPELTKSKFLTGLRCLKMLWWQTHEPNAPELAINPATQQLFDHGALVGDSAREQFPGGVLIDHAPWRYAERCGATRAALAAGSSAIFEASFLDQGVFVSVDVLERDGHSPQLDRSEVDDANQTGTCSRCLPCNYLSRVLLD